MHGPVRILCAADLAFAGPLCAMIVSVLAHHPKEREIIIYILATAIPEDERKKIESAVSANYPHFPVGALHWLSPNRDILQGLPVSEHVNLEAYSRLLAPLVLPADCDRVLYLDSDMIILSDLSPLYDCESNGSALHAAHDLWVEKVSAPTGVFNFAELGISPDTRYFNTGVILMHLRRWREENIAEQVLALFEKIQRLRLFLGSRRNECDSA